MNFKSFLKVVLTITVIVIIQLIIYRIGDLCATNPHELTPLFEDNIPFIPGFIYFYISWYLMLYLVPVIINIYDKKKYYNYLVLSLIGLFLTLIIFIVFPTHMYRVDSIMNTNFTSRIVNYVYSISTMTKCIPSLHCLFSFFFIIPLYKNKNIPILIKTIITIVSFGIIVSTLLVKQHLMYDVIGALIVSIISIYIVKAIKLDKYLERLIK